MSVSSGIYFLAAVVGATPVITGGYKLAKKIERAIEVTAKEVVTNGGSSLRDAVDRIDNKIERLHGRIDALDDRLDAHIRACPARDPKTRTRAEDVANATKPKPRAPRRLA